MSVYADLTESKTTNLGKSKVILYSLVGGDLLRQVFVPSCNVSMGQYKMFALTELDSSDDYDGTYQVLS